MLKRFIPVYYLIIILFLSGRLFSQVIEDDFELVESVPAETILEQSALPRTSDVWLKMINNAKENIDHCDNSGCSSARSV